MTVRLKVMQTLTFAGGGSLAQSISFKPTWRNITELPHVRCLPYSSIIL